MEFRKMVMMILYVRQQRYKEQTYGHRGRGGGRGWDIESNMEIYNAICKIDSQWEFAVWLRELKQGLCDRLKGGIGRWEGGPGGRGHWCTYGWFLLIYDRKPQNFVKQLSFSLKINTHMDTKITIKLVDLSSTHRTEEIIDHSIMRKGRLS